jgi:acyl-CoA thioesterase I
MKNILISLILILSPLPSFGVDKVTTILFIGDSLTEGYGVAKENSYVSLIENHLIKSGKKVKILNGSVSGSTTSSGMKRLKWFLKAKPDILFLELGANDGLRGVKIDISKNNLDKMITLALKNNMKVLLAGMMLPPNYGPEYTKKFKNMFVELSKSHKIPMIPFLLKDVAGIQALNQADGIHPNEKGHLILKSTALKYLEPLL